MVKKRSIILSILAVILIGASFVFFACGDWGDAKSTFESFKTTIETYKSNQDLFTSGTIEGNSTNFYLKNFYSKDENGNKVKDDENYIILNAMGLNFIEKYYVRFENLEGSYDFNPINESLKKMNERYDELMVENKYFTEIEDSAENDIYNGYFARYKLYSKSFINEVYNVALNLGDFFMNTVKISSTIGVEGQKAEDLEFYIDYQLLMSFDDFRLALMQSCEGQTLEHQIFTSASTNLKNFAKNLQAKEGKDLSIEETNKIKVIFDSFDNQRKSYKSAVSGFSVYKFLTTYDSSLEAYVKADSNADTYYNQLLNYYCADNNYITLYYNYLTANLVK